MALVHPATFADGCPKLKQLAIRFPKAENAQKFKTERDRRARKERKTGTSGNAEKVAEKARRFRWKMTRSPKTRPRRKLRRSTLHSPEAEGQSKNNGNPKLQTPRRKDDEGDAMELLIYRNEDEVKHWTAQQS
ncbi:hypothetical protein QTO34_005318, partial [Cnephaeus nilssonii]